MIQTRLMAMDALQLAKTRQIIFVLGFRVPAPFNQSVEILSKSLLRNSAMTATPLQAMDAMGPAFLNMGITGILPQTQFIKSAGMAKKQLQKFAMITTLLQAMDAHPHVPLRQTVIVTQQLIPIFVMFAETLFGNHQSSVMTEHRRMGRDAPPIVFRS